MTKNGDKTGNNSFASAALQRKGLLNSTNEDLKQAKNLLKIEDDSICFDKSVNIIYETQRKP